MYPKPQSVDLVNRCFSCDGTPHLACHECKVLHCALHASILCQAEICVGLRQFWTLLLLLLLLLLTTVLVCLLLLLHLLLTPFVVCGSFASGMQCLLNIPERRCSTKK